MRIFDLTTLYLDGGDGGVNTYLLEKARFLEKLGRSVEHIVLVPGAATSTRRFSSTRVHILRSPRLPGNPQHRVLVDFPRIGAILRQESPDIVEVDCSYLLGHVAARALRPRRVPVVGLYHVHLPMLYARRARSRLRNIFTRITEPLAWRYARYCARPLKRLIVTSRDMHRRLSARNFSRLELVPLGVNPEIFRPGAGRRERLPGLDPRRPVVLYVGRLSPEKDLEVLFRAHRILHRERGSQLLIVGQGPLAGWTRRLARREPGVLYRGPCAYGEELAALYRSADVVAVPGPNESFGLVVLEALACGRPVVAVDRGGPTAILDQPGLGLLARPGDPADLAAKIGQSLAGPTVGEWERRRFAEENFTWEKSFEKLLAVYESAIRTPAALPV